MFGTGLFLLVAHATDGFVVGAAVAAVQSLAGAYLTLVAVRDRRRRTRDRGV